MQGGAWCKNVTDCQDRSNTDKGSSKHMGPIPFQGIHSKNQTANPEMRSDFLNALPKGTNPKHRGVFIDVVHHHTSIIRRWTPEIAIVVHNVSAPKAFADWYFDRNYTYLIDERDLPLPNLIPNVTYSS
ncbi:hypothetical protein RND71_037132 [Anisodus tanguticus]|uniref:Pectin acetylesterase n=1 Tax=Anisodus tanguticus TaxID=243964 RepID=A0AAE1R2R9_9SOLA|nr:hypothetical protein RND71_037132 [Anisodus tanguticus]